MVKIESAQNQTFKKLLSLTGAKGLKQEGLFLLSGEKLVREYLAQPLRKIAFELTAGGLAPLTPFAITPKQDRPPPAETPVLELSQELFAQLDVLGTHFNILVLEQPQIETLEKADITAYEARGVEVVIPVGDPGNLGALIRSCEAFGVQRVILTREAAHPFLPKAVKASAGSVLRVPMARGPSLGDFPATCIALDMNGTSLYEFRWPENGLLVVGEEGGGIGGGAGPSRHGRAPQFTRTIRIPTQGVESLNVVVAASIALACKDRQA